MEKNIENKIDELYHELIPVSNQQDINYDALFKVIVIGDTGKNKHI
jgi:hypothetical protein